ncbi:MAG: cob(I)yrinic acid a,c-diamide adenosyltransferase [Phycisphaeraceae bacterium]
MKLYTRIGDDGTTRLFGNQIIEKDAPRVEAYGCVDELNSALGLAAAASTFEPVTTVLTRLQNRLFDVGADLATPRKTDEADSPASIDRINSNDATELEQMIDAICEPLAPMRNFILPGGSELAARLHLARTICRRAERACVTLSRTEPGLKDVVIFLNRVSDLLFALARRANQLAGVEDVPWRKR